MISAALQYLKRGFSVIPVNPKNKKPFIPWKDYQTRHSTEDEVLQWWGENPRAMIGLVTGAISGLAVIDIDTPEGKERMNGILPDSFLAPTVRTPRGGEHYYCQHSEGLTNNAGAVPGVDLRAEGGYIIAPPSVNGTGERYEWIDGLTLDDCALPSIPIAYVNFLNNSIKGCEVNNYKKLRKATINYDNYEKLFTHGQRDEDLFHAANCLIKGGMQEDIARKTLKQLANSCDPPFSFKDAQVKIDSALARAARRERNVSAEVREWVKATKGYFLTTDCYGELRLTTAEEKKACYSTLLRMCGKEIEKHGDKRGCFRVIDASCEEMDFMNADTETVDLRLPFNIHDRVLFYPGNIVVIAGEPNAGKTAFLINVIKENMHQFEIHYFNSEMGGAEFRKRLSKVEGVQLHEWRFKAWERSDNFADVIKPGKGKLNIIDFLEVHDEFYKVGGTLAEIHRKLKGALAIVAIQKNPGVDTGLGGFRTLEKPRLALAMEPGKLKITKAKNWKTFDNPNGLEIEFKLAQGCVFIPQGEWSQTSGNTRVKGVHNG